MGVQQCPVPDPLTLKKYRRQTPERNQQFILISGHVRILVEVNEVLDKKKSGCVCSDSVCVQILSQSHKFKFTNLTFL